MLVESVLNMASFEQSGIRLSKEPVLVMQLLKDFQSGLAPVLARSNARLSVQVIPEMTTLFVDKAHFTNVLQNMTENALKYNDKPIPVISIIIRGEETESRISITDNGRGIPARYVDKIFDKFFRVPSGDRHDTKGYGLGLSYVRNVVELHRGSIVVQSVPGEGSTFTIQIPKA